MSNEEIVEGNKLISSFMSEGDNPYSENGDFISSSITGDKNSESRYYPWGIMKFATSWDWLMPVVEKIESTELGDIFISDELFMKATPCIRIQFSYCYLDIGATMKAYDEFIESENSPTKIEAVYSVVIQFIQWRNQNNIK